MKKFFDDDSDSEGGGDGGGVSESLRREHRAKDELADSDVCETIDFAPSYVAKRTQKMAVPKQAAAAAAAAAACITSRLLSCESHSVAAPSIKPLCLQVDLFLI